MELSDEEKEVGELLQEKGNVKAETEILGKVKANVVVVKRRGQKMCVSGRGRRWLK